MELCSSKGPTTDDVMSRLGLIFALQRRTISMSPIFVCVIRFLEKGNVGGRSPCNSSLPADARRTWRQSKLVGVGWIIFRILNAESVKPESNVLVPLPRQVLLGYSDGHHAKSRFTEAVAPLTLALGFFGQPHLGCQSIPLADHAHKAGPSPPDLHPHLLLQPWPVNLVHAVRHRLFLRN
ncbi:uncharacterized protein J3R85_008392 [Psidium guajava]|nr:uncharacterized protein J3R85_008392 [Psidium guajava]